MSQKFSIAIVSHCKPAFVKQAVYSVLYQEFEDWQCVVMDSGPLLESGLFVPFRDERLRIVCSSEDAELGAERNPGAWCFNKILNSGMLTGELVILLCDDDLLYPWALQSLWNYYESHGCP